MNAFQSFKPEPSEEKLVSKKELIHVLFANALCLYFTGYQMNEITPETVPKSNSLAYKALAKSFKFAKFNYGFPNTDAKQKMTHFDTNPVVYLIRGPNKSNNDSPVGLEYFERKGIVPVMRILNNYFNPMNIKFIDNNEKQGGSVWMIFDAENFVMPERNRKKPVEEEVGEPTGEELATDPSDLV
jgi:hypothetical protein